MKKAAIPTDEKSRLELVEKRVDITKKRVEIRREKQLMEEERYKKEMAIEQQRIDLDKIFHLKMLLGSASIDEERAGLPGEPVLKPMLTSQEQAIVAKKLIEIVRKL